MATELGIPYEQAYDFGGPISGPRLIVVHSTECPMTPGIGRSLAGPNWFGGPSAGTSAHIIADPSGATEMVHDDHISWNCGPGGNPFTWGAEHCGYAAFTAAEWTTDDAKKLLQASAAAAAKVAKAHGIQIRWLSIAQMRAGESGFCSHNDIRLAFGGTTHSDPGPNFPYALYLQYVKAAAGQAPTPTPTPTPDPDHEELDDMVIFGMARLSQDGPDGKKGDVFKIAYLTNQYAKVPNPAVLKQVEDMHARQFKKGQVDTFDTGNMDRFGTEVKWGQL